MTTFASRRARIYYTILPALALPAALALVGCNPDRLGADRIPGAETALRAQAAQTNAAAPTAAGADGTTPSATAPSGAAGGTDIGLSAYPNAKPAQGPTGTLTSTGTDGTALTELVTPDPMPNVVAYYKQRYPAYTPKGPKDTKGEVAWKNETEDGKPLVRASLLDPNGGNGVRMVRIYAKEGKTFIDLCRIVEDPALIVHDTLPQESALPTAPKGTPSKPDPFAGDQTTTAMPGTPAKPTVDPFAPSATNPFSPKPPADSKAAAKPGKPAQNKEDLINETLPPVR